MNEPAKSKQNFPARPEKTPAILHRLLAFFSETRMLAALLVVAGCLFGFMEVADEVMDHQSISLDEQILKAFRNPTDLHKTIGPQWLETAALDLTALGGTAVLVIVILVTLGFLWIIKKRRILILFAVATLGGQCFNTLLKTLFMRPRPEVVPHLTEVHTSSFPSGHSMMSAVVYLTLGVLLSRLVQKPWLRFYIVAVAIAITGTVGFTRVFLGVHYPTDVVGGWTAGLAWAIMCLLTAQFLQQRGTVEKPDEHTDTPLESPHE